jgi:TolA-binding protein
MSLDKKIISEIQRYQKINRYIMEQAGDVPADPGLAALTPPAPAPEAGAPAPAGAPLPADETPQPIDVESDPEVEKIDDKGESEETESGSEELDITELVDSQKNIETKQEEYFNNLFSQLSDLQSKLSEMDTIMTKLNSLENKIEKYREKTPQEKLELRSYDSYPFNQKLSQFFDDKQEEMEKTGKNDYILTADEVTDINVNDIKNSFQPGSIEQDPYKTSFR